MFFVLQDGTEMKGRVHEDWHGRCALRATTLDLKSAYKQLPLHPADANKTVVVLKNPERSSVDFFVMRTLPFGSSASVLHFNRVSYLLWALGCKLGLVWSCYYDDYPILCPTGLEQSSVGAAKALFNLLGFRYAEDKLAPPADKSEILGVEVDLSDSASGVVKVRNKQDRIGEIEANLDEIINSGRVKPKDVPSQLGRLQFADLQVAGRAGKIAMYDLRQLESLSQRVVNLEPTPVNALEILKRRLTSGKPRTLTSRPIGKPWILFTDGALEYSDDGEAEGSIGAVLASPSGKVYYFGCRLPQALLKSWQTDGQGHVIGLVELYACVVALRHWQAELCGNRVILFVDNYGAQDCLVKGTAAVLAWRKLLMVLEETDDEMFANLWITRVPSSSNPADFPSRGSVSELAFLGAMQQCSPECPITNEPLLMTC